MSSLGDALDECDTLRAQLAAVEAQRDAAHARNAADQDEHSAQRAALVKEWDEATLAVKMLRAELASANKEAEFLLKERDETRKWEQKWRGAATKEASDRLSVEHDRDAANERVKALEAALERVRAEQIALEELAEMHKGLNLGGAEVAYALAARSIKSVLAGLTKEGG